MMNNWKPIQGEQFFYPLMDKYKHKKLDWLLYSDSDLEYLHKRGLVCKTKEQAKKLFELLVKTARKFQESQLDKEMIK